MPEPLTPEQRLALIKQVEAQETVSRRRAVWITWGSVGIAAIVLAAIVLGAWQELDRSQSALSDIDAKTRKAQADLKEAEEAKAEAQRLAERARDENTRAVELVETLVKGMPSLEAEAAGLKKKAADARSDLESLQREVAALSKARPQSGSKYLIEIGKIDAYGISHELEWTFTLTRTDTKRVLHSLTAGGKRKPAGAEGFINVSRTLLNSRTKPFELELGDGSVDLLIEAKGEDSRQRVIKNAAYRLAGGQRGSIRTEMPIAVSFGKNEGVLLVDLLIRGVPPTAKP